VEVKIGVQHANRELVIDSEQSSDDVQDAVAKALEGGEKFLALVDTKGRRVLVPTEKLAYVEIGEANERRVGFGTM